MIAHGRLAELMAEGSEAELFLASPTPETSDPAQVGWPKWLKTSRTRSSVYFHFGRSRQARCPTVMRSSCVALRRRHGLPTSPCLSSLSSLVSIFKIGRNGIARCPQARNANGSSKPPAEENSRRRVEECTTATSTTCRLRLHPRPRHRPTRARDITIRMRGRQVRTRPVRGLVWAPALLKTSSRRRPRQGRAAAVARTIGSTRRRPRLPSRPPHRDQVSTAAAATRRAIVTPVTAHTAVVRPRPRRAMRVTTAPPRPTTSPAA